MSDYWGRRFTAEGMIWGSEPSQTALMARELFQQSEVKSVLVPGAGYGRNAKVFSQDFKTYGIELSQAALELAMKWDPLGHYILGSALESFPEVPLVDAVYCYDVLHLFLKEERCRLVSNCLAQLHPGGLLVFTCFSDADKNFGVGKLIEPGTYEYKEGKYAHFFSEEDLRMHFAGTEIVQIDSHSERLPSPGGDTYEYILRSIVARKVI